MHNIHNVFHMRLSLFLKQLDMNEEDILRITDELLLRRSFILETQFDISWYYFVNFVYKCLSLQFISWTMYKEMFFIFNFSRYTNYKIFLM